MNNQFNIALADDRKPYWIWGPLAFSIFYFLPLIFNFEAFTPLRLIGVFIIYGIFVYCYKTATCTRGDQALKPIIAIVLLSTFGTYITPGTQALFGYAAFFTGFYYAFNKGILGLLTILAAIFFAAQLFNFTDVYFLAPAIIVSVGLYFFGQAERRDRIHNQKEQKSQQQIEQLATIAERERIARDLHDLVGHSLSSIALKAELAEKLMAKQNTEQAKIQINEVAELSRTTLAEIRHAVSGLKQVNLQGQVTKLKKELESQGFTVKDDIQIKQLSPQMESQLTLITTELITNILRHSQGDEVEIVIKQTDIITLTIFDNGNNVHYQAGNGLTGVYERCQQLHTEPQITTNDGFRVTIVIKEQ
ncbi:sensor histidine kinase [Thalassotalea sp. LPB0316]|uniref:sensor histidine kinase n=1 Tax=Thalassotalea sp. LPB0316 TaxID=2769490 RepID=UPI00186903AE|nr:sensor histidine kinase [Thalassotalea sp. LPB0316]QOL25973.1 sensor histidine kinase [Thalassotalea sp. LPB0316]